MMSNTTLKSDPLSLKAEDFSNNNANLENVKKELNIAQEWTKIIIETYYVCMLLITYFSNFTE